MPAIEELELDAHRKQLRFDVSALVNKYRAIFGWDVPEIDEALSDRLLFAAIRQTLNELEREVVEA